MPVAKKAAATKKAAARRPQPQTVVSDFDLARQKLVSKRTTTTVFEWEGFGRTWHVRRPNPALLQQMQEDKATFMDFVLGHFVPEERDDLLAAFAADETFDFDIIELLITEVEKVVYAEIPLDRSSAS